MTSLLCFCFAHLFTGFIAGALLCAGAFGNPSEISRHEDADLLLIIADLETGFGYDDRTLENTRVALDEGNQLIGCHRINIDAALLNDLGTLGYDIVAAVFRAHQKMLDLPVIEKRFENILLDKRKFAVFEPLLDFAAARAAGRCIYNDHIYLVTYYKAYIVCHATINEFRD